MLPQVHSSGIDQDPLVVVSAVTASPGAHQPRSGFASGFAFRAGSANSCPKLSGKKPLRNASCCPAKVSKIAGVLAQQIVPDGQSGACHAHSSLLHLVTILVVYGIQRQLFLAKAGALSAAQQCLYRQYQRTRHKHQIESDARARHGAVCRRATWCVLFQ